MMQIASKTVTADQSAAADINAIGGDTTLSLTILNLTAASGTPRARIVLEDSTDNFATSLAVCEHNIEGPIQTPVTVSWRKYLTPSLRNGAASAKLRVNVAALEVRPFSEAATQFLAWAEGEYREHPASAKRLRTSFASLIEFFKRRPVSSITPGLVEDYKGWRRSEHKVKEVTLRHDLHALSPFFDYAKKHNWTRVNPVHEVDIPSDADAVPIHALTQQEETLYFAAAHRMTGRRSVRVKASRRSRAHDQEFESDYSDLIDMPTVMLQQGCRPEELMSLEKHSVDLAAGKMRIVKGKSKPPGERSG